METRKRILVVDDDEQNLRVMSWILRASGYDVLNASNGIEAIATCRRERPDLVLLDIVMPEMDGIEACSLLKADAELTGIPVVVVTALTDRGSKVKSLQACANDFLTKPVDRTELTLRVRNLLKVKEFEDFLRRHAEILEEEVRRRTFELEKMHGDMKESYLETIYRLTLAAEYRDEDTATHVRRISYYCRLLSEHLDETEEFAEIMFYASPMHDVGKIGIPDSILLKPRQLTQEEFEIMKRHTTIGAKIIGNSQSEYLKAAEIIALTHHERWDGTGYPRGLKGKEIPLSGRIMNLVDQYDSLRSRRPYKPGFDHERTFDIISKGDGRTQPGHFDPQVLEAFVQVSERFNEIFEGHQD